MKNSRSIVRLRPLLLIVGACLAVSCGKNPFAPSTDLGKGIVDDFDPTVTNVQNNLKVLSESIVVDTAFSMRDTGDSLYSWIEGNTKAALAGTFTGLTVDGFAAIETAYTYIEFRPDTLRADEAQRKNLDTAFSIDSVVLAINRFRVTVDSASPGRTATAAIDLYPYGVIKEPLTTAINPKSITGKPLDSIRNISLVSTGEGPAKDTLYTFKLDSTYVSRIRTAVKDSTADTSWFALCLKPSAGSRGVVRFDNVYDVPRILVYYHALPGDTVSGVVSMSSYRCASTIVESDSVAAFRHPYSAWEMDRRTILKLNLAPLRDFMDTAGAGGKEFKVIQRAELKVNLAGLVSDMRCDTIQIQYSLSDTLGHTKKDFTLVSALSVINSGKRDVIVSLPVTTWLQKLVAQKRCKTVYLSLTVPANMYAYSDVVEMPSLVQIDWTQPGGRVALNAIVNSPR
jgi:hypothetical protein